MDEPISLTPFEEQVLFYFHYGSALGQWAHIEHALSQLACAGVQGPGRSSLAVGLYSIESFRAKLNYVDVTLQHRFDGSDDLTTWARLKEQAIKASRRRNQLAHRSVLIHTAEKDGRRYTLVDWKQRNAPGDPGGTAPAGAIALRELVECARLFTPISIDLENLAAKLDGREPPIKSNPPVQTPTLDVLMKEGRQMLSGLYPSTSVPQTK